MPVTSDDGEILYGRDGEQLTNPEYIPVNGRYKIERVHPDNMLWDEDAGPLEDSWGWIAQMISTTLGSAIDDPRYNKRALTAMMGRAQEKDDEESAREDRKKGGDVKGRSEQGGGKTGPAKYNRNTPITLYEIYDLKADKWLTICESADIPVSMPAALPPGCERHPYAILVFMHRDDSPYPHPPLSPLIPLAREYNRARSDIQKHRKRFNRKYIASRQAFQNAVDEISKLESGDDGTVLTANGDARGAVAPIQDAQLDPMRFSELGYLKGEMVEIMGHNSAESMGIASADSATQSAILDKRLEMKEGDEMSMVIDFITLVARKLDMLVQVHLDRDEAVKIVGPQGEFWELIREEDYQAVEGEYEYTVNVGATTPRMPHIERASWMAFLSLLSTFPHLATSKRLLNKMAEMHHIEDEAMIDELYNIAKQILSGQSPMPGQGGSQAGIPEDRPVSAMGGQAGGVQSMMQGNAATAG
jgi:hypothetical protein